MVEAEHDDKRDGLSAEEDRDSFAALVDASLKVLGEMKLPPG